jgi:hypothetical protein
VIHVNEDLRCRSAEHAINRDRFRCIEPGIRGELQCASSPLEDVQNGCAARCGGNLHKCAKHHMTKRIAARRHCLKSGTSDSLPKSPEACGAEPRPAAAATGSASVESTTSLTRASAGTCGGVPPQLAGDAHKQALGLKASRHSLASGHTASRGHERRAAPQG